MSEIQAVHCLVEDAGVICIIPNDSILPGCFRPRGTDGALKATAAAKGSCWDIRPVVLEENFIVQLSLYHMENVSD